MDTITTMTIDPSQAALAHSAGFIGGVAGIFTDRGRALAIDPLTPFVVDPCPARPPV